MAVVDEKVKQGKYRKEKLLSLSLVPLDEVQSQFHRL